MIESGSCGGGLIATTSECEDAATALDLSVKNAYDYTSGSDYAYDTSSADPPGCVFGSSVYLAVYGGGSTGSCSSKYKCICMFTPPSPPPLPPPPPPSPPSPPHMPPGYLQIAKGYYRIESGSCGALISTHYECEAAARALDLSDKTAGNQFYDSPGNWPPGCMITSSGDLLVQAGELWFWGWGSSGSCSSSKQCICKSTSS